MGNEMLSGLIGALIGGCCSVLGGIIAVKLEYQEQRNHEWRKKQYDLFCVIVDFLNKLIEFVGSEKTTLSEVDDVHPKSADELWDEIVRLKGRIIPLVSILFDKQMEKQIIIFYDEISQGGTAVTEEIEAFISNSKEKYFRH